MPYRRLIYVQMTSCVHWQRIDCVLPTLHSRYFTYLSTLERDLAVWALFDPIYISIKTWKYRKYRKSIQLRHFFKSWSHSWNRKAYLNAELELIILNATFFKDFLPAKMKPYVVTTTFERVVKQVKSH